MNLFSSGLNLSCEKIRLKHWAGIYSEFFLLLRFFSEERD